MMNQRIRDCVKRVGDPLMRHILAHVMPHGFSEEEVRSEVRAMVGRGELRMKEDSIDHDWTYRMGRNW